jgi:hypothetical protein
MSNELPKPPTLGREWADSLSNGGDSRWKETVPTAFLTLDQSGGSHQPWWNTSAHKLHSFTKVPCLFHSPTCTWEETKLEALLTCLWFGSQMGITFSAPQAKPKILLAKYYWCPGATSWKSCLQYPRAWEVGSDQALATRTSSKKRLCLLFHSIKFHQTHRFDHW